MDHELVDYELINKIVILIQHESGLVEKALERFSLITDDSCQRLR
ncbi:hypothetical protein ALQ48_04998 [Pseudomonas coronafaciens pv. zizaniae]|nr:hypothetical protein ALQ48_04998 [Pseudomonas coronafaciens pv. zizaniae]